MNLNKILHFLLLFLLVFSVGCSEDLVEKSNKASIKGTVVKYKSNEPLSKVKITTAPTTETVFTGADGSFIINDVPIGDYSVKAELDGYIMEIKGANLKDDGQTVSVVFEMKDDNALNSPPSVPDLITPADNAENQALSVKLSWNCTDADSDSLTYKVILKNNKNNNVKTYKNLVDKNLTIDSLVYGTSYFWQVVASDNINPEVFSKINKFTTIKTPENRFHFVRNIGNNLGIMSSNEAGSSFQLTLDNTSAIRPRKSNAAGVIAFIKVVDGNPNIFTVKPDGSDLFKVTTIPISGFNINELDFSWSANGKEILYPSFDKLYRVNKDGSGTQLVYQTPDASFISECAWSADGTKIALKTNNINGYNVKIYVIDMLGNVIKDIISGVTGAAGGLDFSVDGSKILYTKDISGFENSDYRQLNTHIFIYDLVTDTTLDVSSKTKIPAGYIDIDPRFSPNEAEVIFTQTSNDGISRKDVYRLSISDEDSRKLLFSNAWMPDWE
ncbi:component of the Tol biopolymer transport system [Soonwooa buanensis]|uniref:Component of the Tol biopolymer transport system n=1 Tax=Soonwooa buanensis TaxID=619805 RepID=A0A1T5F3M6_9FLAO|nr:carboxypeptidase regulatory-like domain-containing protein [Soonwooa buanensis]SKB90736.1 component of the Tol biopolymer transport system [Soonwooa buanensis]